jgi:hypothetical protein
VSIDPRIPENKDISGFFIDVYLELHLFSSGYLSPKHVPTRRAEMTSGWSFGTSLLPVGNFFSGTL